LYPPNLTLREAREVHFARGGFSEAQYAARFARFRLGRLSVWLPNTRGRARALPYHDLHHVLTEYPTTWRGEAEIAAWELASGCGRSVTVWLINLGALGLVLSPRATARAFRRGRRSANLYGRAIEELLSKSVGDVRRELELDR
jgi:hypothetical protein